MLAELSRNTTIGMEHRLSNGTRVGEFVPFFFFKSEQFHYLRKQNWAKITESSCHDFKELLSGLREIILGNVEGRLRQIRLEWVLRTNGLKQQFSNLSIKIF